MEIINLVPKYIDFLHGKQSRDEYIADFPELFEHYFAFWGHKDAPFVENKSTIHTGASLVLDNIAHIENIFSASGISLDALRLVLFVGQNVSNGHSAYLNDKWVVWIPIELYNSKLQVDVFLTHELIHGVHYQKHPELYFATQDEKRNLGRQIVSEGVATYATMRLINVDQQTALWADFLADTEYATWCEQYNARKTELVKFAITHWNDDAKELFQANDKRDILRFRGGYGLGLETVGAIAKDISLPALLDMDTQELHQKSLAYLKKAEPDEAPPKLRD